MLITKRFWPTIGKVWLNSFKTAYLLNVLHNGLSFPETGSREPLLESSDQIDGFDLSWTLGVIFLYASSLIPSQSTLTHTYLLFVLLMCSISVMGVIFLRRLRKGFRPKVMDLSQFHPIPQDDDERKNKYHYK